MPLNDCKILLLVDEFMRKYSEWAKQEARKLVRSGLTRAEAARRLRLDGRLVGAWCPDIPATKGRAFSKEFIEKAKFLVMSGKSKHATAKELGVSYEWVKCRTNGIGSRKTIPKEVEIKANELVSSGMQKKDVARVLNLNYQWIKRHTKPHNHFTVYPKELKENVQKLGKLGYNSAYIERSFGLNKRITSRWLPYQGKQEYLKIGGRSLAVLQKLMEKGCFIPKRHQIDACSILSRHLPIKTVRYSHKKRIYFLPGNERNAIATFVSKYYHNNIGSRRLKKIMGVFGIQDYKRTLVKETGEIKIYRVRTRIRGIVK